MIVLQSHGTWKQLKMKYLKRHLVSALFFEVKAGVEL